MTASRARQFSTALTHVILPIMLLTAAMIGLGLLVTHVLVRVWPFTLEDQAVRALVAERTPTWDGVSNVISLVAYTPGVIAVTLVAGCVLRIACRRWREAVFLASAVLGQAVVYKLTAWVVDRARPPVAELDVFPPMRSFFSGHTAAAVALYGGIAVLLALSARRRAYAAAGWCLLSLVPLAVAVSRVYRGMHYPSDVAASILVGSACLWIMRRAMFPSPEPRGASAS